MTAFWRSLLALVLFQGLALAVLLAARRGRGGVAALGIAALVGAASWAIPGAGADVLLAGAAVAAWLVWRAVLGGATLWRALAWGLLPVLAATTVDLVTMDRARLGDELRAQLEGWAGAPAPEAPASAPEERELREASRAVTARVSRWALRLLPAAVLVFHLLQVLVIVAVAGALARAAGHAVAVWPATTWRVPFGCVWGLVAGLALVATRQTLLATVGANVAVVTAAALGVQGLAVVQSLLGRVLPRAARWAVLGLLVVTALPFLIAALVVLGTADLWVDFRRPRAAAEDS